MGKPSFQVPKPLAADLQRHNQFTLNSDERQKSNFGNSGSNDADYNVSDDGDDLNPRFPEPVEFLCTGPDSGPAPA